MQSAEEPTAIQRSMHWHALAGIAVCLFVVFGLGGWAVVAELNGAVIASGTVVVESELKKVQHPTGGVVGELRVKNGDEVKAGDVVLRLDETVTRANLAVVTKSLDELAGRRTRLEAERDDAETIAFPDELLVRAASAAPVQKIVNGERRLFDARRSAHAGQKAQLGERIAQLREQMGGLDAQRRSQLNQIAFIGDELEAVQDLYQKRLVPITRLVSLQRETARLEGQHGQIIASIAEAKGKIGETELQIIQLDQERRAEALKELREIEGKIGELIEGKIAGEDQLKRIDLRSPQDGVVHELAVHTVGGVVGAGETVMLVVPRADALAIDAKVLPQDIDHVLAGQPAVVRLSAFNMRTTPEVKATVTRVSAETSKDEGTGLTYYIARIALAPGESRRLDNLQLVPGMPAEVYIQTGERTALSYFVKPLSDQFARAMKDD
ncbi:MAG: HlyD family type I secretion periplasmic adaptor subunit [Rhizobiales bacterium]|nr:HlyD family type I secretion periplasmic adaptor subunit [Hyphomicrobiales bacterium]